MHSDIQHTQMVMGVAIAIAMLGTLSLSLLGRWIGGVWTTLLATLAACLLAYQPLCNSMVFSRLATDRQQRIWFAAIPFTILLIGLSFKRVPMLARLTVALLGPALMLCWVFYGYDKTVPMSTIFLQKILPVSTVLFATWALLEPIAIRTPGTAAPMTIAFLGTGCGFLLMLSSENQAGLMGLLVPAAAGGTALAAIIAAIIRRPITSARGPVLLWLTLLASEFAYLWIPHSTKELPLSYLAWLASVPLLAWIPEIGPIHRLKPWKRESLRLLLVLAPVIVAIVLANQQHKKEATESGDEYGFAYPAAPILPSQIPIPNTIPPPTIT